MSLLSSWGKNEAEDEIDLATETSIQSLRNSTEDRVKLLLYVAVVKGDIDAIKNLLRYNRDLLNVQLYGFEGADVYGRFPNSKTGRCYTYTGVEEKDNNKGQKDYFYPLHVAAEVSNKNLCLMMAKAGANVDAKVRGR